MESAGDRRRRPLEGTAPDRRRAVEVTLGEVHQREMPHEVVVEPVEARAPVGGGRQARDARVEHRLLVERMRQRVDAPRVTWIADERGFRRAHGLLAPIALLEREGVEPAEEVPPRTAAR